MSLTGTGSKGGFSRGAGKGGSTEESLLGVGLWAGITGGRLYRGVNLGGCTGTGGLSRGVKCTGTGGGTSLYPGLGGRAEVALPDLCVCVWVSECVCSQSII